MVVEIRENQDLERLLQRSKTDPVLIFKHSTQCPISSQAYEEFRKFTEENDETDSSDDGPMCGLVLVIENRNVSNTIAAQLGIRHESPQAIVVKDGKPIWNASHWSITADSLSEALNHAQSSRT